MAWRKRLGLADLQVVAYIPTPQQSANAGGKFARSAAPTPGTSTMTNRSGWKPTFVGIGAQKCATTWCWQMLSQHPEICVAQPKELEFFSDNFHRGVSWYSKHFDEPDRPVQGEFSPLYMDHPAAANRLADMFPDIKIIAVLRNPYDRAISNLLHEIRDIDGRVATTTLERAKQLACQSERYVRRSCYAEALAPYYRRFAPTQLVVLFYEQLRSDKRTFLRTLYSAVGANPSFEPANYERVVNKTEDYVSPTLFHLIRTASRAAKSWALTQRGMEWLYRKSRLRERLLAGLAIDRGRPQLNFLNLFGLEAVSRIADDVARLEQELELTIPIEWTSKASTLLQQPRAA
jgi:hypothetical protein